MFRCCKCFPLFQLFYESLYIKSNSLSQCQGYLQYDEFHNQYQKRYLLIFQYNLIVNYTEKYIYGLMLAMFKQTVQNYLYNQSLELINRKQVGCCVV